VTVVVPATAADAAFGRFGLGGTTLEFDELVERQVTHVGRGAFHPVKCATGIGDRDVR
jgi:hypothetical protein